MHLFFSAFSTGGLKDLAVNQLAPDLIIFLFKLASPIGTVHIPIGWLGLQWRLFFLQRLALKYTFHLVPARGTCRRSARRPLNLRLRHAHDRIGHPVGFLFVCVVRRPHGQLGLDSGRSQDL